MKVEDLRKELDELQTLMTERLRIRGRTFERQLRKAGRLLPRKVRSEAAFLLQARTLMQNPKLARMVDQNRIAKAHRFVAEYLQSVDPVARRKDMILRTAALWSFYVLLAGGCVIAYAYWRGLI